MSKYYFDQIEAELESNNGGVLFYTEPDDTIGYDIAISASNGTLFTEGDVEGMMVYLVQNDVNPARLKTSPSPDDCGPAAEQLFDNLVVDLSGEHRFTTTAEYLDDLVDGCGEGVLIVIDRAEEFFTLDGLHTLDCLVEWAMANGALIVAVERVEMISRSIH